MESNRTRLLAWAAAMGVLVALLPLPGMAARSDAVVEHARFVLGAKNVISGSQSAKIPVRILKDALLEKPGQGGPGLEIEGGEKGFVGFALVKDSKKIPRVTFVGGRLDVRTGLPPVIMGLGGPDNTQPVFEVPAGNYDLYLITDSPNVKVTLRLKGLSGTKNLRPADKIAAKIANPDADYSSAIVEGMPKNLYSAGAGGRTRGPGLVFDVLWQQRAVHVETLTTYCYYQEKPEEGHPAPYAPGCPSSKDRVLGIFGDGLIVPGPSESILYGGGFTVDSSYLGQGFSVTSAGVVDDLEYTALWLSFD